MTSWATTSMLLVILMRNFRVDSITCDITEYKIGEECCDQCPSGHRVKTDCTEFKRTICQRCSDGTFMDLPNGLKRCNPCSTCDSGAGLKEKQQCRLTTDTVCEPMEGFYCTDLKSGGCSVAQKHRSCEPGHYISRMGTASTDTECSECSSGSFSDGTMLSCQPHTQCEKGNLHLIKAGTASTDAECGGKSYNTTEIVIQMRKFGVKSFRCHITEYNIGEECCPMCPAGEQVRIDCTEFKTTSCQKCSDGTFMDLPNGLKNCNPCSTCDSGAGLKVKQQCVRSADTVCEPMEGFYCTDLKSGGCSVAQKHRSCEPGHYISRMGTASTDTECSECSSGSFSDGTMLSCQPHTQCENKNLQLIKAGTASTDAECGGKSSNITEIVIGVLFVFLVVALIVVVLWKTQKISIPNIFTKQQKPQRDQADGKEQEVCLNAQEVMLPNIDTTRSSDQHQQARRVNCLAEGHNDQGRWSGN
ncbi:tumor necrosis factor receptor superfamily member 5-like isoform X3 [Xiphophorus hellerii]|uniref:tumor necrosis factor receptor superfamily member 5-like isoform X3 n=1 Tax=Xiphophorus hellerii TaxID=8084 RepID=UPI0013B4494F|nr:tumor necrosis factor receptor superfamily member 5-like isoform X3 [Xiphophorus hellerii]